jgi:hypothetical protein
VYFSAIRLNSDGISHVTSAETSHYESLKLIAGQPRHGSGVFATTSDALMRPVRSLHEEFSERNRGFDYYELSIERALKRLNASVS